MSRSGDGDFETRLAEFLLVAFAAGHDVETVWHLPNADSMIPDFVISVKRTNLGRGSRLDETTVTFDPGGHGPFEDRLGDFLLTEFSRGVDIEGTWTARYGWAELPEWTVQIERRDANEVTEGDRLSTRSNGDGG